MSGDQVSASSGPESSPTVGLDVEPFVFFHPTLAGRATPGAVQPVPKRPLLEEEPATWPQIKEEQPPLA